MILTGLKLYLGYVLGVFLVSCLVAMVAVTAIIFINLMSRRKK